MAAPETPAKAEGRAAVLGVKSNRGKVVLGVKSIIVRMKRVGKETVKTILKGERESDGFIPRVNGQEEGAHRKINRIQSGRLELRDTQKVKRTPLAQEAIMNQNDRRTSGRRAHNKHNRANTKNWQGPTHPTTSIAQDRSERNA